MLPLPTAEGLTLVLLTLLLLLMGVNTGFNLLYLMAAALLALFALNLVLLLATPFPGSLTVITPTTVERGRTFTLHLEYTGAKLLYRLLRPLVQVTLTASSSQHPDGVVVLDRVDIRLGTPKCSIDASIDRRGVFTDAQAELTLLWPFGFLSRSAHRPVTMELVVTPRIVRLADVAPTFSEGFGGELEMPSPKRGETGHFHGVREARGSVPVRKIHWRLSARLNQIVLIENEQEPTNQITVVTPPVTGDAERFECSLDILASGISRMIREGRTVCMAGFLPELSVSPFGSGQMFLERCLRSLAEARQPTRQEVEDWQEALLLNLPRTSPVLVVSNASTSTARELVELLSSRGMMASLTIRDGGHEDRERFPGEARISSRRLREPLATPQEAR